MLSYVESVRVFKVLVEKVGVGEKDVCSNPPEVLT